MEPPFRIEKKDSFRVVGPAMRTTNQKGQGRKMIPAHWRTSKRKGLRRTYYYGRIRNLTACSALISITPMKPIRGYSIIL